MSSPIPGLDASQFTIPIEESFGGVLGIEIDSFAPRGVLKAHLEVRRVLMQPMGIVHGGIYASVGESLASIGTVGNVISEGKVAVGQSNNTSFLRPVSGGTLHAVAEPLHMGRTTWMWQVEMFGDDEKRCAISMVTLAVRPYEDFVK